MRFGCCVNMLATPECPTGFNFFPKLAPLGFDYVELPLAQIMDLSDSEFDAMVQEIEASPIRCEVCNNFFPASVRLTGPDVDAAQVQDYVERALARAGRLGVENVVFGSGGAKQVPDGFPLEEGYKQLIPLLRDIVSPIAKRYNITIVIEPLRKAECNLINSFAEGVQLAKDVDRDNIKVLVDYYHLTEEHEPVSHVADDGKAYLRHVHMAYPEGGRTYPTDIHESDYTSFINALKAADYDARVSCEAFTDDFDHYAPLTIAFFKKYF